MGCNRCSSCSSPTRDLSTENLAFLSSPPGPGRPGPLPHRHWDRPGLTKSLWVAFGGSYPGSACRLVPAEEPSPGPCLVATSAPVHATVNFPEYLEVGVRSLASEDPECPLLVKKASDTLMERLKDPKTHDAITKTSKMDTAYFLETLAGSFMDVVQYNQDNRQFE
ncbi:unnamed protein product, partial [Gadus morhua 'NCC']